MKIFKSFDARKIVKAKSKTLWASLSSVFCFSLYWSAGLREFVSNHPGLIGVLIAVSGEVYFDWKEATGEHTGWKKFFMALLVVSLAYELYEASHADKEAADAKKLAGIANERASTNEFRVAQLTRENLKLYAQIQPRRITAKQQEQIAQRLRNKSRCRVVIKFSGADAESGVFASQIRDVFIASGFSRDKISLEFNLTIDWNASPARTGLEFRIDEVSTADPLFDEILLAFREAGISVRGMSMKSPPESRIPPTELQISVWPKPFE